MSVAVRTVSIHEREIKAQDITRNTFVGNNAAKV
jgi:hypothetical protein